MEKLKCWWKGLETDQKWILVVAFHILAIVIVVLFNSCSTLRESSELAKEIPKKIIDIDEQAAMQVKKLKCEMRFPDDRKKQRECQRHISKPRRAGDDP